MLVEGTMPRPYSADLRERVLSAHEHGEGNAAAPSRASGGEAVSGGGQYSEELGAGGRNRGAAGRQTAGPRSGAALGHGGMRGAAPIGGGRQRCDFGRILRAAGGADRGQRQPAGALHHSQAPGLAAQKKTLRASEQERADVVAERAAFAEQVKSIAPENLVFLDETGVSTKLTRLYARAPRGQRACGSAPGHWRRLTVLGALGLGGFVAVMTVAVATDWPVFQAFLQQVLIPALRRHKPGATIVMDHLAAHRIPQARVLLEGAGFTLLPLPRYSPDLSPIEPCWSKLKTLLRAAEPRSIAAIDEQIGPALDTITLQDARGWFRHCGYPLSN